MTKKIYLELVRNEQGAIVQIVQMGGTIRGNRKDGYQQMLGVKDAVVSYLQFKPEEVLEITVE